MPKRSLLKLLSNATIIGGIIGIVCFIIGGVYFVQTYTNPLNEPTPPPPLNEPQASLERRPDPNAPQPAPQPETKPETTPEPETTTRTLTLESPVTTQRHADNSHQSTIALSSSPLPIAPFPTPPTASGDTFTDHQPGNIHAAAEQPVSTFSTDVDTASYTYARSRIRQGQLPEPASVRIEEHLNYFTYDYPPPNTPDDVFALHAWLFPTPWNPDTTLLHIGLQAYEPPQDDIRDPLRLVFLVDVSGSMQHPNKLPLLVKSLNLLPDWLNADDEIALVTYAGNASVPVPLMQLGDGSRLRQALDDLQAGGATAGAAGIREAYRIAALPPLDAAHAGTLKRRVMLATDGDFNVGITDTDELSAFLGAQQDHGIFLNVIGFGHGNLDDSRMQELAQKGGGVAAYVDSFLEARKLFITDVHKNLQTVARDVKAQVEFNPKRVTDYRLLGYDSRRLTREQFEDPKTDAADTGAGHQVTVLYELTLDDQPGRLGERRYQPPEPTATSHENEIGFLRLRWKTPTEPFTTDEKTLALTDALHTENPGEDSRFTAAVAGAAATLAHHPAASRINLDTLYNLAQSARGNDTNGLRAEFIQLVDLIRQLPAVPNLGPQQ